MAKTKKNSSKKFSAEIPQYMTESLANGLKNKPIEVDYSEKLTSAANVAILKKMFSQIMNNYRKNVAIKNFEYSVANMKIEEYNRRVKSASTFKKDFAKDFKRRYAQLDTLNYNATVDSYKRLGVLIPKRKFELIKYSEQTIFEKQLNIATSFFREI